jgi:acetyl esterase/lipase
VALAFFVVSLVGLAFTLNAFRPVKVDGLNVVSFFAGWLTSELPLHHLVWQAVATVVFVLLGALHGWAGWAGLAVTACSWVGLVVLARKGMAAGAVVDEALRTDLGIEPPRGLPTARQWRRLAMPFRMRDPAVAKVSDLPYTDGAGGTQLLDIYHRREPTSGAPVLLYIHGGAWISPTDKKYQGLPMMQQLAAHGWVCVSINYRLSPKWAFPAHLIDCKLALAWVKEHIADYGGDPRRIVVSGGSAGGHLAALVALTAGRPELQPGCEDVDLHVQAAVPFYGIYDFANRDGMYSKGRMRFFAKTIMKATLAQDPELYRLASPVDQIGEDAPPFFIIHGANDTLIPVQEARRFAALLREKGRAPVAYAELPGTQHAFEVFRSIRAAEVVPRVEVFLDAVLGIGADRGREYPLSP